MQNVKASIVIRTVPNRIDFLDQALFSVLCNTYAQCEAVVVVQSKSDDYFAQVTELCKTYILRGLPIKTVRNCTNSDERAKNLNLGIAAAAGRYIGFLDDDDILYPTHIASLVKTLEANYSSAWAYADTVGTLCEIDALGDLYIQSHHFFFRKPKFFYPELWFENFIPLHSYIIDRYRVKDDVVHFDESFTLLEDYAFLLKLAIAHEPKYYPEVTCEYRFRLDGSNSSNFTDELSGTFNFEKQERWRIAREKISILKRDLIFFPLPGTEKRTLDFLNTLISQSQTELQSMRAKVEASQAQVHALQAQLDQSQAKIGAMKTSKFWRMRNVWFRFNRKIGLGQHE
ncbi:glycosyltransferase family 2 protein [Stenomitos frigidus]|nr:glycosyltransferase family 2 protein [Stenomitos frigidus]